MSNQEIFDFLKNVLLTFVEVNEEQIQPETKLEDLDLDSLDYVQLQVEIKKKYQVMIDFKHFTAGEILTLANFVDYIQSLKNSQLVEAK